MAPDAEACLRAALWLSLPRQRLNLEGEQNQMNNLVFNTVSSQLRTLITNPTLTVSGDLEITNTTLTVEGSVEITNTALTVEGSVEITNTVLNVEGEVTLTGTASVEVTNTALTVEGSVEITNTVLNVEGEVTLTGTASVEVTNTALTVEGSVEITNTVLNVEGGVSITGHEIAETNTTVDAATGTGVVFGNTDISQITTGSFFVYNTGASAFTISLQVSPTTDDGLYAFDVDNDELPVPVDGKLVIAISKYGRYARLLYDAGAGADFSAYYIGQM
jgi:hypothetical protein